MRRNFFRGIYFRIYLSKYFLWLQSLNEEYSKGNNDAYLREMEAFYSNLLSIPETYNQNTSGAPLAVIYPGQAALFLKLEQSIVAKNVYELNVLAGEVRLFLDKLYDTIFSRKRSSKRIKYAGLVFGFIVLAVLFAFSYSPLKKRYSREREQYQLDANGEAFKQKTIEDLLSLKRALQKYHSDSSSYPKSSGGWDAIISDFGESKKDWIPSLAPRYINELPLDPRKSNDSKKQYMYKSDGKDFKLIAHNPVEISALIANHPELVDPARASWAIGVWSEGAKTW